MFVLNVLVGEKQHSYISSFRLDKQKKHVYVYMYNIFAYKYVRVCV